MSLVILITSCTTTEELRREQMVDNLSVQVGQGQRLTADTLARIEELENKINRLNGTIEEKSFTQKQGIDERIKNLEEKITILEESQELQKSTLLKVQETLKNQTKFIQEVNKTLKSLGQKTTSRSSSKSSPKVTSYDAVMKMYRSRQYTKALPILVGLLNDKSIKGDRRARIYHNIGMISFIKKNYDDALINFSKLYTDYGNSPYVANGLLYLGKTFQAKKQIEDAKSSFSELIAKYPKTNSANAAKNLLANLK